MGYQRVRYIMINDDLKTSYNLETDPKNWDESEKSYKRSMKTFGVVTVLSKNLEFVKGGKDFLDFAYAFKGIEARVTLQEYKIHPNTEAEYLHSEGTFDFSGWENNKTITKIPFKTGGLNALVKSQFKEKFELDRTESINGKNIEDTPLKEELVALTSRQILLVSKLETEPIDAISTSFRMSFTTPQTYGRSGKLGVPLTVTKNSDERISSVIKDVVFTIWENVNEPDIGRPATMFYYLNDVKKILQLKLDFHCIVKEAPGDSINDISNEFLKVELVKYNNGIDLNLVERFPLYNVPFNEISSSGGHTIDFNFENDNYELLPGESLSLEWHGSAIFGSFFTKGEFKVDFEETAVTLDITEDSFRDDSQSKAVLFHEVGSKLMQILTGNKTSFYSEFYGRIDNGYLKDGEFSLTALALGFWIRIFDDEKLEFSISDLIETSNAIHNTGYTIDKINGAETLILEDMKFFFQNQVVIKLPNQVNKLKRKVAKEFVYANLQFGYKYPSGDNLYEEAMGLDEYNVRTNYVNPITRVDSKYIKLSEARADSYGKEFARRKPKIDFAEEDTRYDKHAFILDLIKKEGELLVERTWDDDYEVEPKNVFSPGTATGLRLTPYRISERHQWFYGAGLTKFQNEFVRYSSGVRNTKLITQKKGEVVERAENGDIQISELKKALFVNEWVTFEHEVDFFLNELINGHTEVGGRQIPNYFFKIQFINELNVKEYGFLFDLKPNKEGKWRLLKAI